MASMEVTIRAIDLASRVFERVADNSEKAAKRIDDSGKSYDDYAKKFEDSMKRASDAADSFANNVTAAAQTAQQATANPVTFTVDSEGTAEAVSDITAGYQSAKQASSENIDWRVVLQGFEQTMNSLRQLRNSVDDLSRTLVAIAVAVVGTDLVLEKLRSVRQASRETDDSDPNVHVTQTGAQATESALNSVHRTTTLLDGKRMNLTTVEQGADGVQRKFITIQHLSDRLDGRHIRLNIDAIGATLLPRALGDSIHALRQLQTVAAAVHAVTVPAMIGAFGGAVTALLSLAGAAGSAAVALGQGLAGGVGVGISALSQVAGGFGLVAAAAIPSIVAIQDHREASTALVSANRTAASASATLEKAHQALAKASAGVGEAQLRASEGVAQATEAYNQALEGVADAERAVTKAVEEAGERREAAYRAYQSALRSVEDAERSLREARAKLAGATESVVKAQREYNQALEDEPRDQAYAALDLADARDRLSDATREYNEAVVEYGANSEEATDALRAMQRAELDLSKQSDETTDIQVNGSKAVRDAYGNLVNAQTDRMNAEQGVEDAVRSLGEAQEEAGRAYEGIAKAQKEGAEAIAEAERSRDRAQREAGKAFEGIAKAQIEGQKMIADAQAQVGEAQDRVAQATDALAAALEAADLKSQRWGATLTATQQILLDTLKSVQAQFLATFGDAMAASDMLMVKMLNFGRQALPELGQAALLNVGAAERAFDKLAESIMMPEQIGYFRQFLDHLPHATESAAVSAGSLALALFNAFVPGLEYGQQLLFALEDSTLAMLQFTQSAEGMATIAQWWEAATARALELWQALVNIVAVMWNLSVILLDSGMVDKITQGFVNWTAAMREFTAAGSEGSERIHRFLEASSPILDAIWRLVMGIVKEFGRVAEAIALSSDAATGLNPLVIVLDHITAALPHIGNLIIENMVEMGPKLGPLLLNLAKLAEVFLAAIPPLLFFIDLLNIFLGWFTELDPTLQRVIMSSVSWAIALGSLGFTISTIIGFFAPLGAAIAWVAATVGGPFLAALTAIGGPIVTFAGWVGTMLLNIPILGSVLGFLTTGPIGWLVLGLGAVVVAIAGLIANWDTVVAYFTEGGASTTFDLVILKVQEFVYWLRNELLQVAYNLVQWFLENWPIWQQVIIDAANAIWAVAWPLISQVFTSLYNIAVSIVNWFVANWPTIVAVLQGFGNFLTGFLWPIVAEVFGFVLSQAATIVTWFSNNWPLISQTVQVVASLIGAILSALLAEITRIVQLVVQVWNGGNNLMAENARLIWDSIKVIVEYAINTVLNILKAVMQAITGDWSGAWETILQIGSDFLDMILTVVGNVLEMVANTFDAVLSFILNEVVIPILQGIYDFIAEQMDAAWQFIKEHLGFIGDLFQSIFDALPEPVQEAMKAVAKFIVENLESGINTARGLLGDLMGAIADVLSALSLDSLAETAQGVADGLKVPVTLMAEGGSMQERGGKGTQAARDKHVVWNEAVGQEWWISKAGPVSKQQRLLADAAPNFGMAVVPAGAAMDRINHKSHRDTGESGHPKRFAMGGTLASRPVDLYAAHGATAWEGLWDTRTAEIARETESATGAVPNTYVGHPDGWEHRAPYSIDWWGSGGRGDPIGVSLGDAVLSHIQSKYGSELSYWIWNYADSLGGSAAAADSHWNHVHATFMGPGEAGGGGASGSRFNWMKVITDAIPTIKGILDQLPNTEMGAVSQGLGEWGGTMVDKIKTWLIEKAKEKWGTHMSAPGLGGFSGGGDPAANRELGKKMLNAAGWGQHWDALDAMWTKESGWDHLISNMEGSGAYGIPQALPGSKMASAGADWETNPATQIAWGLGYIDERYGDPSAAWAFHQANNWYERGGVIPGSGPKPIVAHGGERVLPVGFTKVFDRLIEFLRGWGIGGQANPAGNVDLSKQISDQTSIVTENQSVNTQRTIDTAVMEGVTTRAQNATNNAALVQQDQMSRESINQNSNTNTESIKSATVTQTAELKTNNDENTQIINQKNTENAGATQTVINESGDKVMANDNANTDKITGNQAVTSEAQTAELNAIFEDIMARVRAKLEEVGGRLQAAMDRLPPTIKESLGNLSGIGDNVSNLLGITRQAWGLEAGGVVNKATPAIVGEGRGREYVIPTESKYRRRTRDLISSLSSEMGWTVLDASGRPVVGGAHRIIDGGMHQTEAYARAYANGGGAPSPIGWHRVRGQVMRYRDNTGYGPVMAEAVNRINAAGIGAKVLPHWGNSPDITLNMGTGAGWIGLAESNGNTTFDRGYTSGAVMNAILSLFEHEIFHQMGLQHAGPNTVMSPYGSASGGNAEYPTSGDIAAAAAMHGYAPGAPRVPAFHSGGVVLGRRGSEGLAKLKVGEGVLDEKTVEAIRKEKRPSGSEVGTLHVNMGGVQVYQQPGEDGEALARRVREEFEKLLENLPEKVREALEDIEGEGEMVGDRIATGELFG